MSRSSIWHTATPDRGALAHATAESVMPADPGRCGTAQDDAQAALAFAEGEIRRLLSGRVSLSDLIMTGGLWRITGQQVLLLCSSL